jgi:adenylosuccinate lyase
MMEAVKNGGDRQELHEKIRVHSMEAGKQVKVEGKANDLIERIIADKTFNIDEEKLLSVLKPENYIGRAPEQTEEFINDFIKPVLDANSELLGIKVELSV